MSGWFHFVSELGFLILTVAVIGAIIIGCIEAWGQR